MAETSVSLGILPDLPPPTFATTQNIGAGSGMPWLA